MMNHSSTAMRETLNAFTDISCYNGQCSAVRLCHINIAKSFQAQFLGIVEWLVQFRSVRLAVAGSWC